MARTTLSLDDDLFRALKRRAASEGRPLQALVNDLLRHALRGRQGQSFRLTLKGWKATLQPGVDLLDRDKLFDLLDGR